MRNSRLLRKNGRRSGLQDPPNEQDCARRQVADDEEEGAVNDQLDGVECDLHRPGLADYHRRSRGGLGALLIDGDEGLVQDV